MKLQNTSILFLLGIFFMFSACEEEYDLGTIETPTGLQIVAQLEGADADNPFGDGSGIVHFTATASNNITFQFMFGDGRDDKIDAGGKVSHQFTKTGVNTYNVTVVAIGKGGVSSSKTMPLDVLSIFADAEAEQFLTGGSTRTWYWASDQPGHTALGPSAAQDDGSHTFGNWWSIGAWDDEKSCMYANEFVFTQTEDGITFEQAAGPAFVPGAYAGVIGIGGDVCHDETVVTSMLGVKNVSFAPASSNATEVGGYRGTSFSISDGGFMGWFVGKSEYEIIEISDNIMKVRVVQDETFAWYHTFVSVKPEQ